MILVFLYAVKGKADFVNLGIYKIETICQDFHGRMTLNFVCLLYYTDFNRLSKKTF